MLRLMICGIAAVSVGLVGGWALGATQRQEPTISSSVSTWESSLALPSEPPRSLPEPAHADPPDDPTPHIRAVDIPANPPPVPVQPASVQTKASSGGNVGGQADKPRKRKRRPRDDDD
jgi:hypothetical protein